MACRRRRLLGYLLAVVLACVASTAFLLSFLPGADREALTLLDGVQLAALESEGRGGREILSKIASEDASRLNKEITSKESNIVANDEKDEELREEEREEEREGESEQDELREQEGERRQEGEREEGNAIDPPVLATTAETDCEGPFPSSHPHCSEKMQWMADHWTSDKCYAVNGVDGTRCSFQIYLSEVEKWCPPLKSRQLNFIKKNDRFVRRAKMQDNLGPLISKLTKTSKFDWIKRRIERLWPQWVAAAHRLEIEKPFNHSEKSVLLHIGALTDKAGFHFAENADHGGPLGELVQWSDLIASLHLLGHNLDFSTEATELRNYLENGGGGCPSSSEMRYSAIFIDIVGLKQFKKHVRSRLQHYSCLFRVLDSFGTEPVFNYKAWKPPTSFVGRKVDMGQMWGNWELNPRQFMNMYPHTPDNSFLGFVVEIHLEEGVIPAKKNLSLVYGKELYMWKNKRKYVEVISRYVDVHATVGTTRQKGREEEGVEVPGFVLNHGVLDPASLQTLLQETKIFVGLGFPYEGPAPLEAIGNGCYFINPKLNPPLNRVSSDFFKNKPTNRALTSQNPYTEVFIGKPYVYTIDVDNLDEVRGALKEIMSQESSPPPYVAYEFTFAGMLERIAVYMEHLQFCDPQQWPPLNELTVKESELGVDCKDTCYQEGLVCEPAFFSHLNSKETLESNGRTCSSVSVENSVHGPSFSPSDGYCSLQSHPLLFSCVGADSKFHRLCPCRAYRKGQVALCLSCTR